MFNKNTDVLDSEIKNLQNILSMYEKQLEEKQSRKAKEEAIADLTARITVLKKELAA